MKNDVNPDSSYIDRVTQHPDLSIIIPTYHEEGYITNCLESVYSASTAAAHCASGQRIQVIIVDASKDNLTAQHLQRFPQAQLIRTQIAQRAHQLNLGAQAARADTLFFVHADSLLPYTAVSRIHTAIDRGHSFGQFTVRYDGGPLMIRFQEYISKYRTIFSGGGDQGFWITKSLFQQLNGYNEQLKCMEDFDLYKRAKRKENPIIFKDTIRSSSRKYTENSYFKVQLFNISMLITFYLTRSPKHINRVFSKFKGRPKLS